MNTTDSGLRELVRRWRRNGGGGSDLDYCADELESILTAAGEAQPTAPAGMVLVPREPTREMWDAAYQINMGVSGWDKKRWDAMLAAAPAAQVVVSDDRAAGQIQDAVGLDDGYKIAAALREAGVTVELGAQYSVRGQVAQVINAFHSLAAAPAVVADEAEPVIDLAQLKTTSWPDKSIGGMTFGMPVGVKLAYNDIEICVASKRSQHKNRDIAMRALTAALKQGEG